ncbi:MAG: hypothetical protein HKN04_00930 [Rhodothermaceae bacterium]|nr:hypothetical protein [Rhodothermaceae bacterium]
MNALGLIRTLGPVDLRNIRRDPLLAWSMGLPVVIAFALRWGIPALAGWLLQRYGFDLTPYYPLLASGYFIMTPAFVGFIVGFLLIDERDDGVLDAMRATPVPMNSLLAYRLGVPIAASLPITLLGYFVVDLAPLPLGALLAASLLATFSGPIMALFLASFAENKVAGFALAKLYGAVTDLPLVAWFIATPWQWAFGLLPLYWPMKVAWQAASGEPWLVYALIGLVVNGLGVWLLLHRFHRVLYR